VADGPRLPIAGSLGHPLFWVIPSVYREWCCPCPAKRW